VIPPPPRPDLGEDVRGDPHDVPWRWWHALALYLVVNLGIGILLAIPFAGGTRRSVEGTLVVGLSAALDVIFLVVMIAWLRRRSPTPAVDVGVPARGRRWGSFWAGVPGGVVIYVAALGIQLVVKTVLSAVAGREVGQPSQLPEGLTEIGIALALVLAVVVAPVTEELFFRGVLFRSLRRHGFWVAAIVSGLVFGAVHLVDAPALNALLLQLPLAGVGVGLAWIFDRWGLTASIGAHVAFNLIGVTFVLTGPGAG